LRRENEEINDINMDEIEMFIEECIENLTSLQSKKNKVPKIYLSYFTNKIKTTLNFIFQMSKGINFPKVSSLNFFLSLLPEEITSALTTDLIFKMKNLEINLQNVK